MAYIGRQATKEYNPSVKLSEVEKEWISKALIHHDGNLLASATALGISRPRLYRKLKDMGVSWRKKIKTSC